MLVWGKVAVSFLLLKLKKIVRVNEKRAVNEEGEDIHCVMSLLFVPFFNY